MNQTDLKRLVNLLTADRDQWMARTEAAENGEIPYLRERLATITAERDDARARIAELEAALAARARVPDREKVARAMYSKVYPTGYFKHEDMRAQKHWLGLAEAAISVIIPSGKISPPNAPKPVIFPDRDYPKEDKS